LEIFGVMCLRKSLKEVYGAWWKILILKWETKKMFVGRRFRLIREKHQRNKQETD
jgi:hypothetical protein